MGIRICPKCKGKVSTSRNVCIHCGYVFPSSKKCPDCGEPVDISVLECPVCGYLFNKESLEKRSSTEEKETAVDVQKEIPVSEPEKVAVPTNASGHTETKDSQLEETNTVEDKAIDSEKEEIIADNEQIAPINENPVTPVPEEKENDEISVECPYCGSKSLMPIGTDLYMCNTCKGKFLNAANSGTDEHHINDSKFLNPLDSKGVDVEVSISEDNKKEEKPEVAAEPEKSIEVSDNTANKFSQTTTENKKCVDKPKTAEHTPKAYHRKRLKKKRTIIITAVAVGLAATFGILTGVVFVPISQYNKAMTLLKNGDTEKAIEALDGCIWADSKNQAYFARARKALQSNDLNNVVYYMYWGKGQVYAEYNANGGGHVSSGYVDSDRITATSTRTGYTFGGWSLNNYTFSSNNYKLNLSLNADWWINNYNLTVSSDNPSAGSVSISGTSNKSKSVVYNSSVTIIANANTGYRFSGWYDEDGELESASIRYTFNMPAYSVHYVAEWVKISS